MARLDTAGRHDRSSALFAALGRRRPRQSARCAALYLGNTDYRIRGTNSPSSIGKHVSSGCIRIRDADVIDLYDRVGIGTKVVVLPNGQHAIPISDQTGLSIEGAKGAMTARIAVQPAARADRAAPRAEWSSNPTPFGLY